jgi:hypothetical protein
MATKTTNPGDPKKGRRALIWGGLGLVVVFLGLVASLWYLSRERAVKETALQPPAPEPAPTAERPAPPPAAPAAPAAPVAPGERTYRVKEGENLWAIAREGVLVDNPWEWRTIMVQNKDKIDYAFVSEESGEWKVLVESGEELTVRARPPAAQEGAIKKKFAIQLMTLPAKQMGKALDLVKTLLRDGYYGYLYRIEDQGRVAYRIRVGFFETDQQANEVAQQILAKYQERPDSPRQYWVMVPSDRELRGELLDFGAQRAKPWVIELPMLGTQGEALEEMRSASGLGDFVYIAQGRGNNNARFVYRTRIGFFQSAQEAETVMARHKDRLPQLAEGRVVELSNFNEILPGQNFRLRKPKP